MAVPCEACEPLESWISVVGWVVRRLDCHASKTQAWRWSGSQMTALWLHCRHTMLVKQMACGATALGVCVGGWTAWRNGVVDGHIVEKRSQSQGANYFTTDYYSASA